MKRLTYLGVAAAASLSAAVALVAQDVQEASAPSPEALARMAPGPMHAKLEPLIGNWKLDGKWRMTPDAPWTEFEATVEREWILGGRFVQETVASEFLGEPFEAIGVFGYDNTREEFTSLWLENMSTAIMTSTGTLKGNTLTFEGVNANAMTGEKDCWSKSVVDLGNRDRQTYKGFGKDANGVEFQNLEMIAVRE